jgi:hypothetical protein
MSERGMSQPTPRLPGWWTLVRDIASFIGGWALVFTEVQRPEIRESVLVFAASVVGVPIAVVGAQTVVEAVTRRNGTGGSSSSPPAAASEPSPSSPS